ncbi:GNAT family N-acetyltransferase [Glutamicibacter sp.]|uniref:GNAT family N-acetyltransferase n=1 Tax=Glutamicibacter sp. TaxID=1931995 RepID=UPI003D6A33B2
MEEVLVLRELVSVDEVPDLLDIWRSSVERRGDFLSAADIDAVAVALEVVYSQAVTVRIAQQGQRIVGFAAWSATRIELLWVRHSDRQKGVGRILLDAIIASTPGISIHLDCQRQPAIAFFADCGFEPVPGGPEALPQRVVLRHM